MTASVESISQRHQVKKSNKIYPVSDHEFFVESSDRKIMYKVGFSGNIAVCTCQDYQVNKKSDPHYRCTHIIYAAQYQKPLENEQHRTRKKTDQKHPSLKQKEHDTSSIPSEFLVTLKGKQFILYRGLLSMAHKRGLIALRVEIIQFPSQGNDYEAIAKARAESESGSVFEDIGDANPKNVTSMIIPHLLRMASTRAKARVLRDMVNIGICSVEELGEMDEEVPRSKNTATYAQKTPPPQNSQSNTSSQGITLSEAQARAIKNIGKRKGLDSHTLEEMVQARFHLKLQCLTPKAASSFIKELQEYET